MATADIEVSSPAGPVRILTMRSGENVFNPAFLDRFHSALDQVEADAEASGLVTVGEGRYFCNGFDLGFLGSAEPEAVLLFVERTCELLGRVLTFPMPTVAAVNGHAFGVGAILALAHDQQVMNEERGWLCLPEIDLGLRLHPFLQELVVAKLGRAGAAEAILSGARRGGADAAAAGFVHQACPAAGLIDAATGRLQGRLGRGRQITADLKRDLFGTVLERLGTAAWGSGAAGT
ncbi:MAG TPA: enoyl-CoA hydratase-related protein [Acidimicrobiales bacterium]|nr:enoyl-CoA hydratase-related protein [Acidimicrobiales bacterium]